MTLVMGPPSRLEYVRRTMGHLQDKGFPRVRWLRTPDADDLNELAPDHAPEQRVLMIWYTTVFPAVQVLCAKHGCEGVFVMEDTCILIPEATYEEVCRAVGTCRAGVFGYGNKESRPDGGLRWHGTKGLSMTEEWTRDM